MNAARWRWSWSWLGIFAVSPIFALAGCGAAVNPNPFEDDSGSEGQNDSTAPGSSGSTDDGTSSDGGTAQQDSSGSGSSAADGDGSTDGTKFDMAVPDGGVVEPCGGGGGGGKVQFSYIWIANSNQGTVSKINTQTMVEEARYATRPDVAGNPSRTSVNLNADVAVANRNGGLTMIQARMEDCLDANYTSAGPDDIKPWQDGCIGWYTPMQYTTQRPIAWTQGVLNEATCEWEDAKVWTAGGNAGGVGVEVVLVDGETGVIEQVVPIPEVPLGLYDLGLYGGAVDGDGNFWASQLELGQLVRVDLQDFSYDHWPMPISGYGMTVDHMGRPWTCNVGVARFDPATEQWQVGAGEPGYGGSGCMEDANGTLWVAGYSIVGIDVETMEQVASFPMPVINGNPDTGYGRGISIDFDGYVWSPSHWSNAAYRLDPETGTFDSVTGLEFPYTYSDMTGFQLAHAGTPAG